VCTGCFFGGAGEEEVLFQKIGEFFGRDTGAAKDGTQRAGFDGFRAVNRNNGASVEIGVMAQNSVTPGLT